jgi:hypothetical protein
MPGLNVLQSWYQGLILGSRHTRGITEAVVVSLLTIGVTLGVGVAWGQVTGLYVGLAAFGAGSLVQTVWLWHRGRVVMQNMLVRTL